MNRRSKPFDLTDVDVDFIDEDYNETNNSLPYIKSDNINEITSKSNGNNYKNKNNNNDSNDENWEQNQSIISPEDERLHKSATLALGEEIAGITGWESATDNAYGIATTLYECHPNTKEKAGETTILCSALLSCTSTSVHLYTYICVYVFNLNFSNLLLCFL